jgi:bacillolysin
VSDVAEGFHNQVFRREELPSSRELVRESADLPVVSVAGGPRPIPMPALDLARRYLDLAVEDHAVFRSAAELRASGPGVLPARGPAFVPVQQAPSPLDGGAGTMVRFAQVYGSLRVYGARATVFLDADRELVHLDVDAADPGELESAAGVLVGDDVGDRRTLIESFLRARDVLGDAATSPFPSAAPGRGFGTVFIDLLDGLDPPVEPVFFRPTGGERFLLCWLFRSAGPPTSGAEAAQGERSQDAPGREPRRGGLHRWFIDAADSTVVEVLPEERYGAVQCSGEDERPAMVWFDGYRELDGRVSMRHHLRPLVTFDLGYRDHTVPRADASDMVLNASEKWGGTNRAAVSAYTHATLVHAYLVGLGWFGSSAYGTAFDVVVNWSPPGTTSNEWRSAKFVETQIIFGQQLDGSGRLVSWAQHRQLVAHEMAHAVTKSLANLNGTYESGALDESISDTFGVAIDHLLAGNGNASTWNWELGPALGAGGGPIRDMSDPGRGDPKQPDHLSGFAHTTTDDGGVHTNSGIHNLAMQRLLTTSMASGSPAFTPDELLSQMLAVMAQLTANSGFSDMRRKLLSQVGSYYMDGTGPGRMEAIEDAYESVGVA